MDNLTLILILLIFLAVFLFITQKKKNIKPPAVKKDEIIQEYEDQMLNIIERNRNDKANLIREKTQLLKKVNYELSMNLFFDEKEAKEIIKKLNNIN